MSYIYLDNLLSGLSSDIGIDLGTSNTALVVRGKGLVMLEPSYVAQELITGATIAVGGDARRMEGRTPENIQVIRPVQDGVIADFDIAEQLIEHLLRRIRIEGLLKPRVIVGVPTDITDVEWRAVSEAVKSAGARTVYVIQQPLAGAIGAGLQVMQPAGNMIVDIGGGTAEMAVISMGTLVQYKSSRIAGDEMDEAIQGSIRKKYNMLIGIRTAEELKISIGSARREKVPQKAVVKGRDLATGLPRALEIDSNEIFEAIQETVQLLADLFKQTLEATPPELVADIYEQGVTLTGGASLIRHLDEVFTETSGVICKYAEDPISSVALGCEKLFRSPKLFKTIFLGKDLQVQNYG